MRRVGRGDRRRQRREYIGSIPRDSRELLQLLVIIEDISRERIYIVGCSRSAQY
jgi:hypothetical protein